MTSSHPSRRRFFGNLSSFFSFFACSEAKFALWLVSASPETASPTDDDDDNEGFGWLGRSTSSPTLLLLSSHLPSCYKRLPIR